MTLLLRLSLVLALAACSAAPGAASGGQDLPPNAAVLPGSAAAAMLRQCSRSTPEAGEATWQPEAADIAAVEAALPAALAARRRPNDPDWPALDRGWGRQYVGIVRGGRRYVYGNFFPPEAGSWGDPERWKREPVMVCDGGPAFFGVEYDVEERRITHLDFNGMA